MATIDLKLTENATQVATTHEHLTTMATSLTGWADDVNTQRNKAMGDWEGMSATAFENSASFIRDDLDDLQKTVTGLGTAVETFHTSLTGVQDQLGVIKSDAQKAGLVVQGDVISLPPAPPPVMMPQGQPVPPDVKKTFDAYNKLIDTFNELAGRAKNQFHTLYEAHLTLETACHKVEAPHGVHVTKKPEGGAKGVNKKVSDSKENADRVRELGLAGLTVKVGRYAPRGPDGRFIQITKDVIKEHSPRDIENWVAKAGNADKMAQVRRLEGAGKLFERVGFGLSLVDVGLDGAEQWERDSHDPTLSWSAKGVRAVAAGVVDNAASVGLGWAGTEAGATVGAEVGSFGGPVGIVVGGAIGGVVGGFLGSKAGEKITDSIKDTAHHVIDKIFRW